MVSGITKNVNGAFREIEGKTLSALKIFPQVGYNCRLGVSTITCNAS